MLFIAVHGGAGSLKSSSENVVKSALRRACRHSLSEATTALQGVEDAISVLEDDPSLNAGHGSNLTLDGTVECDASLMDGSSLFGAVGAVEGIQNPIRLAHLVLCHSQTNDTLGRIPPLLLTSNGAKAFASRQGGIKIVAPQTLVSDRATKTWQHWSAKLSGSATGTSNSTARKDGLDDIQDTVGAVAYERNNETIAAGVSRNANFLSHKLNYLLIGLFSGGLLLKLPGRIGEAATFGAGCWARKTATLSVACSVSGAGEHIVRAALAKTISDALYASAASCDGLDVHETLCGVLTEQFWEPCRNQGVEHPDAGVLVLIAEDEKVQLWCAFTTLTMAIAYGTSENYKCKATVLRQPVKEGARPSIFITAISLL